ncbi:MAG: hypothetical protein Fur0022_30400 [Anaerolineales bacterium]
MANIKTAISLQKPLFEQVDALAHELNISRSRLFVLALEDFVRRYQNRQLLEQINQAYSSDPEEQEHLYQMQALQKKLVEDEW